MTLADLKPGLSGKILKINSAGALKWRLTEMEALAGRDLCAVPQKYELKCRIKHL